jgi:hypothetical protein
MMDLREQVVQFRGMLEENGFPVDDFELNVNSDAFKELLAGGSGGLEVRYRKSGIAIDYQYDGTPSWLEKLADDLDKGKFLKPA